MQPIRLVSLLLFIVAVQWSIAIAQTDQWRIERLGLPPASGEIRVLDGVYHSASNGLSTTLDPDTQAWNAIDLQLGTLRFWSMHASGIGIIQRGNDVLRYNVKDRSITERSDLYYQFEHDDSIVAAFTTRYDQAASSFLSTAAWINVVRGDTLRIDTVAINDGSIYNDAVPCADSTALVLGQKYVIRFRYDGESEIVALPDTLQSNSRHVYIDATHTQILLMGRNSLMYSTDHGRSWLALFSEERPSISAFCATNNPDRIVVVLDSSVIRYHVSTGHRDTLHVSARWASRLQVDHGPQGTIVSYPDTVLLIDDATGEKQLVHSGLPERSLVDLIAVPDGIAGAGQLEVVHHPSQGEWSTPPLSKDWLNIDPYGRSMIFRGGRDLNDLWVSRGSWALRLHPKDFLDAAENLLLPEASFIANPTGNRFTVITNIEGMSATHQVTWWNGSSPDRILLQKDSLSFLIGFQDSVLVAFGRSGVAWRTTDASHLKWEELNLPVINLGIQPRSQVKGRHGVVLGPRMKAWTNDAGKVWQVDSLPQREFVALANNGVMYHVREEDQPGSEFSLVIDRQIGIERMVVAALPDSIFDQQRNNVTAVAYDDNEHRLYIATDHWVGSLAMSAVSVEEDVLKHTLMGASYCEGIYDLFGRYLGNELPAHASRGLYLVVTSRGVQKRILPDQGFE